MKRLLSEVSNMSAPRAQSTRQRAPPPSFLKWYAVCTGSETSCQKIKIKHSCKPASDRQKLTLLLASVVGVGLKYPLMTRSWDERLPFVFGGSCGCKAKYIWNFGLPASAKHQKSVPSYKHHCRGFLPSSITGLMIDCTIRCLNLKMMTSNCLNPPSCAHHEE